MRPTFSLVLLGVLFHSSIANEDSAVERDLVKEEIQTLKKYLASHEKADNLGSKWLRLGMLYQVLQWEDFIALLPPKISCRRVMFVGTMEVLIRSQR